MTRVAIVWLFLVAMCTAQQQVPPGNLTGRLVDSTGAAVADAKVTAVGAEGSKTEVSNQDGGYLFPLLRPAVYELTIQSNSHKTLKIEHVIVVSNKTITSRIELPSGSPAEVITTPSFFAEVDTRSRSANLGDMFYKSVPTSKKPADSGQQNCKSQAPAQQLQALQSQPPDLSDAAREKCKKQDDCHWDAAKGCVCVIVLDGDGSNVLLIDTQSSAVQKNTADYEYERLPIERSLGGILSLP
jgi:hypothetical protein